MARGSVNIGGKNYDLETVGMVGKTIAISGDGLTVTETFSNGDILETVFNVDGTITETFTQGSTETTKITTFVSATSITEVIS